MLLKIKNINYLFGNYTFPLKLKSTFYETEDKKIEKDKEQIKKIN